MESLISPLWFSVFWDIPGKFLYSPLDCQLPQVGLQPQATKAMGFHFLPSLLLLLTMPLSMGVLPLLQSKPNNETASFQRHLQHGSIVSWGLGEEMETAPGKTPTALSKSSGFP